MVATCGEEAAEGPAGQGPVQQRIVGTGQFDRLVELLLGLGWTPGRRGEPGPVPGQPGCEVQAPDLGPGRQCLQLTLTSPDVKEGVASYLERRPPRFPPLD